MNREILFKAKRLDNGEWIEGLLIYICLCSINENEEIDEEYVLGIQRLNKSYQIDPTTLCQFTGLTDKNGRRIFENDICSTDIKRPYAYVVFRNGCFMYQLNDGEEKDYFDIMMPIEPLVNSDKYTEVIGNVFDNPELLDERKL